MSDFEKFGRWELPGDQRKYLRFNIANQHGLSKVLFRKRFTSDDVLLTYTVTGIINRTTRVSLRATRAEDAVAIHTQINNYAATHGGERTFGLADDALSPA